MTDDDFPFDAAGGSSFGAMGLTKTLVDMGMCKDCALRLAPLLLHADAIPKSEDPCSDTCADVLDRWAHPYSSFGASKSPRRIYTVSTDSWIARKILQ